MIEKYNKIRPLSVIKKRVLILENNLSLIKYPNNIIIQIDTLNKYLKDPFVDLNEIIKKTYGEEQKTYKWIAGLLT